VFLNKELSVENFLELTEIPNNVHNEVNNDNYDYNNAYKTFYQKNLKYLSGKNSFSNH
jgi:hypothetical protein